MANPAQPYFFRTKMQLYLEGGVDEVGKAVGLVEGGQQDLPHLLPVARARHRHVGDDVIVFVGDLGMA